MTVVVLIALTYCCMFLAIIVYRPYVQRLAAFLALAVAGLQAVSAIQLVAMVITNDPDWERASGSFALASIYVLAVDGLLSSVELLRQIGYFVWKKYCKDESEGSIGILEEPMLEGGFGDRRNFNPGDELQSLVSGSNSNGDGGLSGNPSFALNGRSLTADPRANASPNAQARNGNPGGSFSRDESAPVPSFDYNPSFATQNMNFSFATAGAPARQVSGLDEPDDLVDSRPLQGLDQQNRAREQLEAMSRDGPGAYPAFTLTRSSGPETGPGGLPRSILQDVSLRQLDQSDGRTGLTPQTNSTSTEDISNVSLANQSFASLIGTDSTLLSNTSFAQSRSGQRHSAAPGSHLMPQVASSHSGESLLSSASPNHSFAVNPLALHRNASLHSTPQSGGSRSTASTLSLLSNPSHAGGPSPLARAPEGTKDK